MNKTESISVEDLKKVLSSNQPETAIVNAIRAWKALILELTSVPLPAIEIPRPADVEAKAKVKKDLKKIHQPRKDKPTNGHHVELVMDHTPFNVPPGDKVRDPRPGTKRAELVKMLRGKGATVAQVMQRIGWTERLAYSNIRAMDRLGYGIVEDGKGRIRLVAPA